MGKFESIDLILAGSVLIAVYCLTIIHPALPVLTAAFGAVAWVIYQYKLKEKEKSKAAGQDQKPNTSS